MRAIVIDDSRAMRSILKRVLTQSGFADIAEGADGREALAVLAAAPVRPDLALVDWNMPNMNGLEFVRAVRADPHHAAMKIVMVTTEVELTQVSAALEAGANDYVFKPFTPDGIQSKLAALGLLAQPAAATSEAA